MSERLIAVCTPELHGDSLWALPAARGLANKHGCRADYWLSHRGMALADLLSAQSFVRRVFVRAHFWEDGRERLLWRMLGDCSMEEVLDDGTFLFSPAGNSHDIKEAERPCHGYEAVYQLGFRAGLPLPGTLLDYFCQVAGLPRQGHYLDLPDGCPAEPLPEGPFVALAAGSEGGHPWIDVFRDFTARCPLPVVEVGRPGWACCTDRGSLDRHRPGFLEMAGVISRSKYYVGRISAPLVVADAFPHVTRIAVTDGSYALSACTTSGPNHYPVGHDYRKLLSYIV